MVLGCRQQPGSLLPSANQEDADAASAIDLLPSLRAM